MYIYLLIPDPTTYGTFQVSATFTICKTASILKAWKEDVETILLLLDPFFLLWLHAKRYIKRKKTINTTKLKIE